MAGAVHISAQTIRNSMPSVKVQKLLGFVILVIVLILFATQNSGTKTSTVKLAIPDTVEGNGNYVILNLKLNTGSAISITGWRVSNGKDEGVIGAVSPLPLQGKINEELPLIITKPSQVIISWGESPIGISFRENKCTGLLGTFQTFIPLLTEACMGCEVSELGYPEYNLCVEKHKQDSDFFLNTWRVYLGKENVEAYNKVIRLYDQNGKLLDIKYSK